MDKLGAMRAFTRVVRTGSFSAAAREANTSQATISKRVAGLEEQLGAKLMMRTSRKHSLTQAGAEYYEKCVAILAELDEAESIARAQVASPRGVLRVTAAFPLGRLLIAPLIAEFLSRYPEIQLDLALTDRHVDLIGESFDVAIRAQQLEDTSLVARELFKNPLFLIASPDYLAQNGVPERPDELTKHNCIIYSQLGTPNVWHFGHQGQDISVRVNGNFRCDNGDAILEATAAGVGLAVLPFWMIHSYLESGQVRIIMPDFKPSPLPVCAVYPQRRYLPLKVRYFTQFIMEKFAASPMVK
jgi:DNA-binding transcriptional LysR family regulator